MTTSLVQAEHDGALAVFPAADLAATTLRRAAGIWWHYATAGKVRPQDVDDHTQATMAEWWRRTDGEALSRPRAAALLRYAIAATWSAIIDGRDPATSTATLPDYATKPVPTEYLACKSRPCDLVAAVQAADARRMARQQDLLSRAAAGIDHHDPPGLSPVLPSDHVQTLRQSLRIVQTGDAASTGVPGTLRMVAPHRRTGTGCGNAARPAANALLQGVADVQVLPGVDVTPGLVVCAPLSLAERQAYAAWLAVFAR